MVFIFFILVNLSFDVRVILFGEIHEKWEKWITDHVTVRTFPIQPLGHTVLQSSVCSVYESKIELSRETEKKIEVICDGLSPSLREVAILDDVITLYVLILNVAFQTVVPWNSMIDPVLVE